MTKEEPPSLFELARVRASRREMSAAEMARWLRRQRREADEAEIRATVERLAQERWIDDARWRGAKIRTELRKGRGAARVLRSLREGGVEADYPTIEAEAESASLGSELERARRWLDRHFRAARAGSPAAEPAREAQRWQRRLVARGFRADVAIEAWRSWRRENQ